MSIEQWQRPWPYIDNLREERRRFNEGMRVARIALRTFLDSSPTSPGPWSASEITRSVVEDTRFQGIEVRLGYLSCAKDEMIGDGELVATKHADYRYEPRCEEQQ